MNSDIIYRSRLYKHERDRERERKKEREKRERERERERERKRVCECVCGQAGWGIVDMSGILTVTPSYSHFTLLKIHNFSTCVNIIVWVSTYFKMS